MERKTHQGFTLIELLVAIAIAGILLGIGVPSFAEVVKESRISAQYNAFVGSLFLARSEAVKGPGDVTVCPREAKNVEQCGDENDWENGWLVFLDNATVIGESRANIGAQDVILGVEPAIKGDNTVTVIGSSNNAAANAERVAFIRYQQNGGTQWDSASVIICDTGRGSAHSRSINIVLTGDIRRGRVASGNDAPSDVFNRPITAICESQAPGST